MLDGIEALLYRTPQEHLNETWKIIKTLPSKAPPRHVRVHLYLDWKPGCDETDFVRRHSALVADFPLEPSGRLALARVRSKWALRGCTPIDTCRRAQFDTVHPEYVSPLALRVLTEPEGVLKLFEPTPSEGTLAWRALRLQLVTACDNFWMWFHGATLGWLGDTIGLFATAILLTVVMIGVPMAVGWYVACTQGWLDADLRALGVW